MDVDYRLAFELSPVGLCVSRNRAIVDCNSQLCEMFGSSREVLVGQSFLVLYPSVDEYERLGVREYVIVDRFDHRLTVLTLKDGHYSEAWLGSKDVYTSPLLPGLSIPLAGVI